MISAIDTTAGKGHAPIYQLKVVLLGSKPPVWRRLQVPGDARLDWLHAVLQVAIGWTNSHLHQFKVGADCYSDTRHHFAEYEGDPEILEERKFTLRQIAPREQDAFRYEYDFGDSWEHEITVEKILPADAAAAKTALCLDGARACPPEDCGGLGGYDNLLKILKNRKHPEHKSMKEWLGRAFDAAAFDVAKTNLWLRKLKWPHVTEAQLRKILMGRDDYRE
jgi:Plasmid pRiA4b ORF-3-like protein